MRRRHQLSSDAINVFLNALNPPQPSLYSLFTSLGIICPATLLSFASLLRRDDWLTELVSENRLTFLEKAIVEEGFHRFSKDKSLISVPESDLPDEIQFCSGNGMHNFLMNLYPPMPHLIPFFQRVGIKDAETLRSTARLTERDESLRRLAAQGVMTHLEARVVGEGMAEVVRLELQGLREKQTT